jgi:RNA polymerase sigma-70 factor (ECF subfamily)
MSDEHTTTMVRRYLDELGGDSPAEPVVRALLDRAVGRWELNDLARRLDYQGTVAVLDEGPVPAPATSASGLSQDGLRMLRAIDGQPEDERDAFDLMRIQRMT